jgi:MFS family permease
MNIISGLVVNGLLVLSLLDELKLIYIYVTTFVLSTCNIFFNTPLFSSIPNIVDEENLTRINSLSQTISSAVSIVGPFVGGLIYAIIDIRLFLLINGFSFLISGVSEMFIDFELKSRFFGLEEDAGGPEHKNVVEKKSIFGDLKEGINYIISQKWLMALGSFAVFLNMLVMMGLNVPVPYIVRELWGFTSQQFGILNTMFPVGILVGSLILSVLPQPKRNYKRLVSCLLIFSILIVLVGVVTSEKLFVMENAQYLIILMVLYIIIAATTVFINVPINVTIQRQIPDKKRGRVAGALGTLTMGFSPLGAVLGGVMVDVLSPWLLPMGCGIIMIILTLVMLNKGDIKSI